MEGGLIGLIRWGVEFLLGLFKGQLQRRQPLFRQAVRMLTAFEAHGVPRHQVARIMPTGLGLTPQEITSPSALCTHLLVEHLDWTSELLAIRRDWLDLEGEQPHHEVRVYKNPRALYQWLDQRQSLRDGRMASMHVLTEDRFRSPDEAHGRLFVVYEEAFAEIDGKQLSRYWYLSHGYRFEHMPCVIDLLGILAIAEHFAISRVGHVVSRATTRKAEDGTLGLIPPVLSKKKHWQPQVWVPVQYSSAGCATEGHRLLWEKTREKLFSNGLDRVLTISRYGRE